MSTLWLDVVHAVRVLLRSPFLTAAIVLVLALGIGVNAAMVSVIDGVLLRPLPYPAADRLAVVHSSAPKQGAARGRLSPQDFTRLRASARSFDKSAVYYTFNDSLRSDPASALPAESLMGALVSADFFSVLQVAPLHGRAFVHGDDQPGAARVIVLGERLWKRRYNSSPAILGAAVNLGGTLYTVVGVMPASVQFPRKEVDFWIPVTLEPQSGRGSLFLRALVRLKPAVTLESARADLDAVALGLSREFPQWYRGVTFPIVSMRDDIVGDTAQTLWIIGGVVVFVLVIAIANIANLMLARATVRQQEVVIRRCLGASRGRLLRQFFTEGVTLSFVGAAGAVAVAYAIIAYLRSNLDSLPRIEGVRIDSTALWVALGLGMVCGVVFGSAPALYGSRLELTGMLAGGSRRTTQHRSAALAQRGLIVAQVALCFVLLIGAGLLTRSAERLAAVDPGFDAPASHLLTMLVYPSGPDYTRERRVAVHNGIVKRVQSLPGVQSASFSAAVPPERWLFRQNFHIEGRVADPQAPTPQVTIPTCTPEYFSTVGIPLRKGRLFTHADTSASPPVAVISETMARLYFPNEDPIGKRIKRGGPELTQRPYMEIVGVVGDVRFNGLRGEPEAVFYTPLDQDVPLYGAYLVVRASSPSSLVNAIRREIQSMERDAAVSRINTVEELIAEQSAQVRFSMVLLSTFAALSLLLAGMGVYALASHFVAMQTAELGIRAALGATQRDILTRVMWQSVSLGLVGLAVGGAVAAVVTRFAQGLLFGVSEHDVSTMLATGTILVVALLIAGYVPARRATSIDPAEVLREAM